MTCDLAVLLREMDASRRDYGVGRGDHDRRPTDLLTDDMAAAATANWRRRWYYYGFSNQSINRHYPDRPSFACTFLWPRQKVR